MSRLNTFRVKCPSIDVPVRLDDIKNKDLLMQFLAIRKGFKHEPFSFSSEHCGLVWTGLIDAYIEPYNKNDVHEYVIHSMSFLPISLDSNHELVGAAFFKTPTKVVKLTIYQPNLEGNEVRSIILAPDDLLSEADYISSQIQDFGNLKTGDHCKLCTLNCSKYKASKTLDIVEFEDSNLINAVIQNVERLTGDQLSNIISMKSLFESAFAIAEKEIKNRLLQGDIVGECYLSKPRQVKSWLYQDDMDGILSSLGLEERGYSKKIKSPSSMMKIGNLSDQQFDILTELIETKSTVQSVKSSKQYEYKLLFKD